jgi:hypothetical protein
MKMISFYKIKIKKNIMKINKAKVKKKIIKIVQAILKKFRMGERKKMKAKF